MIIAMLTAAGTARALDSTPGMTFVVDNFGGVDDRCANVRDYRYGDSPTDFCIWTLGPDDYTLVGGGADLALEVRKTFTCMRQIADDMNRRPLLTVKSTEEFMDRLRGQALALESAFSANGEHTVLAGSARATAILVAAVAEAPELQSAIDDYRTAGLSDREIVDRIRLALDARLPKGPYATTIKIAEPDFFMLEGEHEPNAYICLRTVDNMVRAQIALFRDRRMNSDAETDHEVTVREARMGRVEYMVRRYVEIMQQAAGQEEEPQIEGLADEPVELGTGPLGPDMTPANYPHGTVVQFRLPPLPGPYSGRVEGWDGHRPIVGVTSGTLGILIRSADANRQACMAACLRRVEAKPRHRMTDFYRLPTDDFAVEIVGKSRQR